MRKTQQEQIKAAKRAYILTLSETDSTSRFTVYLDAGKGLEVLWPEDTEKGAKCPEMLCHQVYSKRRTLPAYHFSLSGYGYSKINDLARELKRINPKLDVSRINGHSPSTC